MGKRPNTIGQRDNLQQKHPMAYAEGYQAHLVQPVTTYSEDFVATFAYLKVKGFTSPGQTEFMRVASQAFPEDRRFGFQTVRANRAAGVTCRTWVLAILGHLKNLRYLNRTETSEWFEHQVKTISMEIESNSALQGGLNKSYHGAI